MSASAKGEGDALVAGPGAAPPRPWYRRRRVIMTAAAAVALLATLGSLSALPSGRSASGEVAQAPDPTSATTTTASGSPGMTCMTTREFGVNWSFAKVIIESALTAR